MKNLRIIILLFTSLVISKLSSAQDKCYDLKTSVINLGVGFGYSVNYYSGASATPVLSASYEYGIAKLGPGTVGAGAILSYQGSNYEYSDAFGTWKDKWTTTFFGLRGTWHPDALVADKYDVYGALQLGYYHYGYTYSGTGAYESVTSGGSSLNSGIGLGLVVGGRYYFTKSIGAFAELGYDIAYFKIGLSAKF
ncbi:MAG: hypothetical protein ABI723_26560 [Bacteroidia bacterium]